MKKQEYDKINSLEKTHWWYVGMREISLKTLNRFTNSLNLEILDVGCGTGGNMEGLSRFGRVFGIDLNETAITYCKQKNLNCQTFDMTSIANLEKKFDLITFFESLSQLPQQKAFNVIKGLNQVLNSKGLVLIREPAFGLSSGNHDIDVGTLTRFKKTELENELLKSGFSILYSSYINSLLYTPIVLKRKVDIFLKKEVSSDVYEHSKFINSIFLTVLRLENKLLSFFKFPFGVTILLIAQKN